ncbi:hypothetical protein FJTKL_13687 [Diaporthe vaccinii]|uniref:Uncharacterized protein n=1 Tax=Diaporthe vaccinii TaxID=105482 RepID=A0ABR4E9P9_9PEZI
MVLQSDEDFPTCATFLYSTTASETFTMLTCWPNTTLSGPLTACVHDDCGPATITIPSTVVITTPDSPTTATRTGPDSTTTPTSPRLSPPTTSSTLERGTSDTQKSSSSTMTDTESSPLDTQFPESTSTSAASTKTQASSGPPLGLIIGGTLGGLAIAAAVAVALVWLLYVKRKDGRSGKSQSLEPGNEQRAISAGVVQLEDSPLKPELSALSPAMAPSLMSSPTRQQEPTSLRDSCLETRHELPAGKD